ncbi:response regulator transcription factor [Bacillus sp. CH30_1T]|uniref:response regulator transcription factor n=1 Tax=Bacillus sp. CH30_1T TaxID=2604836 RepID=UPI0011F060E9|nr:LuxR C-terminal-related transcriptional regulator [Bacillus sp. CH30_1T]KAA0560872.1 response regulator transcription factor [Bacillus sp. CH30_1T]
MQQNINLSSQEIYVAQLVSEGKTDGEIANTIFVSKRRVGEIISNIKNKWNISTRVELGIQAYRSGLLKEKTFS